LKDYGRKEEGKKSQFCVRKAAFSFSNNSLGVRSTATITTPACYKWTYLFMGEKKKTKKKMIRDENMARQYTEFFFHQCRSRQRKQRWWRHAETNEHLYIPLYCYAEIERFWRKFFMLFVVVGRRNWTRMPKQMWSK
jgi:hypothetical protein